MAIYEQSKRTNPTIDVIRDLASKGNNQIRHNILKTTQPRSNNK